MSTCLVLLLAVGLVASCIADLFSHNTIMDGMEISNERWLLIQSSSLVSMQETCTQPLQKIWLLWPASLISKK